MSRTQLKYNFVTSETLQDGSPCYLPPWWKNWSRCLFFSHIDYCNAHWGL